MCGGGGGGDVRHASGIDDSAKNGRGAPVLRVPRHRRSPCSQAETVYHPTHRQPICVPSGNKNVAVSHKTTPVLRRVRPATQVDLTSVEREQLEKLLRASGCTVAEQRRARIMLLAADGVPTGAIAEQLRLSPGTVSRWRTRIARRGFGKDAHCALADAPRAGRPRSPTPVQKPSGLCTLE